MKITVVKYGRTIEVGGPFGKRPVERVWFGWEAEVSDHPAYPENEAEVLNHLKEMADEQEQIEREEHGERRNRPATEAEKLAIYNETHGGSRTKYVIQEAGCGVPRALQPDGSWGPRGSAWLFSSVGLAHTSAGQFGISGTQYEVVPE